MPALTFDELAATVRDTVVEIGQTLTTPHAEWHPALVVQGKSGRVYPAIDLRPIMSSDEGKARLAQALPHYGRALPAKRMALVLCAWVTHLEPQADGSIPSPMDRPRPREDPNRGEIVTVTVAERGRMESWTAAVKRTPVGPRLGPWEGLGDAVDVVGDLPDALRKAVA